MNDNQAIMLLFSMWVVTAVIALYCIGKLNEKTRILDDYKLLLKEKEDEESRGY